MQHPRFMRQTSVLQTAYHSTTGGAVSMGLALATVAWCFIVMP